MQASSRLPLPLLRALLLPTGSRVRKLRNFFKEPLAKLLNNKEVLLLVPLLLTLLPLLPTGCRGVMLEEVEVVVLLVLLAQSLVLQLMTLPEVLVLVLSKHEPTSPMVLVLLVATLAVGMLALASRHSS